MQKQKSLLIIGGSGFIGTHLVNHLRKGYVKVFATYQNQKISIPGVTFLPFNLEDRDWIKKIIYLTKPDILIYVAGSHDLKKIEKNIKNIETMQSASMTILLQISEILQTKFIFVSSCYVFDGLKGNYKENDTTLPEDILGKLKLDSENVIKNKSLNYLIIRSSPLFGRGNGKNINFLDHIRMKLDKKEKIFIDYREIHSYAPIQGLCETIEYLIGSGIKNKIFHYGGLTKLSLFEFAKNFSQRFSYDTSLIVKNNYIVNSKLYEKIKIKDFSLNSSFIIEKLKIKPLLLEEGFDLLEKQSLIKS